MTRETIVNVITTWYIAYKLAPGTSHNSARAFACAEKVDETYTESQQQIAGTIIDYHSN
jgi:hypothetical protein